MSWTPEHVAAPSRLSLSEAAAGAKKGCRTREDFRRFVRPRRLRRAKFVLTAGEAAWLLVVEPKQVYAAIRNGSLPAEREVYDPASGAFRWRILRSDVLLIADAWVSPANEDRIERIRIEKFEGQAGDPPGDPR